MKLTSSPVHQGQWKRSAAGFVAALPLLGVLACNMKDDRLSVRDMSYPQIMQMHRVLHKTDYGREPARVAVSEVEGICTANCRSSVPEETEFNYGGAALIVDVSAQGAYHKYAYTKEGKRLWEGLGDSRRRVFVMRDKAGTPQTVEVVRNDGMGWAMDLVVSGDAARSIWADAVIPFSTTPLSDTLRMPQQK